MTKKEARKKTRELIRRSADRMRKNVERVFLSGAVNLPSYEDNYLLPTAIMLALLEEETRQFKPSQFSQYKKQIEKDAKNIYVCIKLAGGCEPNFTTTTQTFNSYNYGYNKQRNH